MGLCKICGNSQENIFFIAREMMSGSREEFEYLECGACGCVQLVSQPGDMSDYYANDTYGSFGVSSASFLKSTIRNYRNKFAIFGEGGWLGAFLNKLTPLPSDYCMIKNYATKDSSILDVGCGVGSYMVDLKNIGFQNVSGIDPFLNKDVHHSNGVVIQRKELRDVKQKYDVIVSHHSFEHVPDPLTTLKDIKNLLTGEGVCLLTVPTAESLYKKYRENCYLIQAPQHFFLFTVRSMCILADHAGMQVDCIERDSDNSLDWCKYSQLWQRDVAVNEVVESLDSHFNKAEQDEFKCFVDALENKGEGDNVAFVLSIKKQLK